MSENFLPTPVIIHGSSVGVARGEAKYVKVLP